MKRYFVLLICICVLLGFAALGCQEEIETALPEETTAPTPSPEPVTVLYIDAPADCSELIEEIRQIETVETVEIADGMQNNAEIGQLIESLPEVTFHYAVQIGDAFVSPDTETLSAEDTSIREIAGALPLFHHVTSVSLGARTPEEISEAQMLMPSVDLDYSVRIYGREVERDAETLHLSDLATLDPAPLSAALPYLPALKTVVLGLREDASEVLAFCSANPSIAYDYEYRFTYLGQTLSNKTETLDLSHMQIDDLNGLREAIAMMPDITRIEMIGCGIDDETMGGLQEEYPGIKFVWEIDLGYWGKLRTDATAFSTRSNKTPIQVKNKLKSEKATDKVQKIRYCTDLVALDLGHQSLTDLSFLKPLKKLRVLILADNYISDIGVIGELPELEYIELFMNRITDLSPLANLQHLRDLNICSNRVADFTPICSIRTLERLWYARNDYTKEDHEMLRNALPDCVFNYTVRDATGDGWRYDKEKHRVDSYAWMIEFFTGAPRYE